MFTGLDWMGGVAGVMFAAAVPDYHRDWPALLSQAIRGRGQAPALDVCVLPHHDGCLTGRRSEVIQATRPDGNVRRH